MILIAGKYTLFYRAVGSNGILSSFISIIDNIDIFWSFGVMLIMTIWF